MKYPTFKRLIRLAGAVSAVLMLGRYGALAAETSVSELAGRTHFHGIAVDRADPGRLYLATHHGVFIVDLNGGAVRISANRNDYMGFTPHPTDPDVLFGSGHPVGGGNMGFIRSLDKGKTWEKLSNGINGPVDFHQMDVSKADPAVIAGISHGFQKSRDGGRTWKMIAAAPGGLIDLAASAKDVNTFYGATRRGLVRSVDGGRSWKPAHLVRRAVTMVHVVADGTVYAFQLGTGLIRTTEPKLNWRVVNSDFGNAYILHLGVHPDNAKQLYAITGNQQSHVQAIMSSPDGGKTWRQLGGK
ncbi:MAG: exo-alpha-sialidase [Rhodospirillaceae bacterium]|nr:exo-alpha-sialidase [Rhodospirillaceae bacterium]MBT5192254.1 exo-alpha-sialidase [Rhodospirillaceae bacterium]MBT6429791.1 exo-alpha-sialidase [Rhodospirillaceae bacterium]MBT7756596.1 exo-alpha-sialidase [Rhodospirillaceae bacterium]